LPSFLRDEVRDYGTFIVSGWFEALKERAAQGASRWEWVIATVDEVSEDGEAIKIVGRAERFEPQRFAD
jgi:hypothetical protein